MKGWKTILAAILTAIFGALEAFDFTNILNGDNSGFIVAGLAVVFAWLRKVTDTALGVSKK